MPLHTTCQCTGKMSRSRAAAFAARVSELIRNSAATRRRGAAPGGRNLLTVPVASVLPYVPAGILRILYS